MVEEHEQMGEGTQTTTAQPYSTIKSTLWTQKQGNERGRTPTAKEEMLSAKNHHMSNCLFASL